MDQKAQDSFLYELTNCYWDSTTTCVDETVAKYIIAARKSVDANSANNVNSEISKRIRIQNICAKGAWMKKWIGISGDHFPTEALMACVHLFHKKEDASTRSKCMHQIITAKRQERTKLLSREITTASCEARKSAMIRMRMEPLNNDYRRFVSGLE
jgi:hypothetical protein